jgi:transposase
LETFPITGHSLELFYGIDGDLFERQYKQHLSGYTSWEQKEHAEDWLLFPENIGTHLSIDETAFSNGDLYTILSNKAAHGKKGAIVAIVEGVNAETIVPIINKIPVEQREQVIEVTHDLSDSMRKIVTQCFPKARHTIDHFHVQKLANDAVQEMRITHRWEAIQADTDAREEAKLNGKIYTPEILENGDTLKELLARSRYLLFKSADKWTDKQKQRARILFQRYPDLKEAYGLAHSLRMFYAKHSVRDAARLNLARWYDRVAKSGFKSFNVLAATIYEHYDDIINYFIERSTNAAAESLNAKLKAFRAQLHGVNDLPFFLFRVSKIFA